MSETASFAEYDDVQGLIRHAHGKLPEACYLLLRIADARAARQWLAALAVATAVETTPRPTRAVQIAFTAEGLQALGVPTAIVSAFAPEFVEGMAAASRARRLGDVGTNAPDTWTWGVGSRAPHLVVMLFAAANGLSALRDGVVDASFAAAFTTIATLDTVDLGGFEPFGFVDGISQPKIDWDGARTLPRATTAYDNVIALGEIVLGYRNEYGKYTRRPVVDASTPAAAVLPPAADDPAKRDVGRNGTYVVFRQLEQDVRLFWRTMHALGRVDGGAAPLAEMMVGRRMTGEPLVDPAAPDQNEFSYDGDPDGYRCPIGAHIRRANPRTADYPPGTGGALSRLVRTAGFGNVADRGDLLASSRFHRILRRGREYGERLLADAALREPPHGEAARGLHFICLNANPARQFEFVQSAWIMNATFGGTHGEADPLLGARQPSASGEPSDAFTAPRAEGLCRRVTALPQFVTVKGGAYFFMPGIRALQFLTRVAEARGASA